MISSEELQDFKLTTSNKEIWQSYLNKAYKKNELTRINVKVVFSHFFNKKFFGYKKHIFEIDNQNIIDFKEYLENNEALTLISKKARFKDFKKFISYIFNNYNNYFTLEQKVDMYFLLNDNSWQKWKKSGHKQKKIKNPLTIKEIEKLADFMKLNDHYKYLMMNILIITGMRKGELIAIKLSQIDPYTKKLTTLEEYIQQSIIPTEGKTGYKEYPIPEDSNLKKLLLQYIKERRKINVEYQELFLSQRKKPYYNPCTWPNKYLNRIRTQLAFPKVLYPHLFRHTLNTLREEKNCPEDIREFLVGHAPTTSNKRYTHRDRKRKVELATKFNPYRNIEL